MINLSDPTPTATAAAMADLLRRASAINVATADATADTRPVLDRLTSSVVRPPQTALGRLGADQPAEPSASDPTTSLDEAIWTLAENATCLRLTPNVPT